MRYSLNAWMVCLILVVTTRVDADEVTTVLDLWPAEAPGPVMNVGPEADFTKPTDRLIAGRRIIKLGNVSTPQLHVYRPLEQTSKAAVVVCPGGGFSILAWDLEGTEVAEWLNTIGVTALVLKYRVPTRDQDPRWLAPVQDAQRALRLARHHATSWALDPERIGILGFSAGGNAAGMCAVLSEGKYPPVDAADDLACRPNFAALIYPGGLVTPDNMALLEHVKVTPDTAPMFFAHAFDDRVRLENSLLLGLALKKQDVAFELHLYSQGGHGYGLRETEEPVTAWHQACARWMAINGWLD